MSTPNYGFESKCICINSDMAIDLAIKRMEDQIDRNTVAITAKVDKADGHSLISANKLEQITENKNHIECLGTRLADAKADIADRYTKTEVDAKLERKASRCELEKHFIDPHAHQELFDRKVDKREGYGLLSTDDIAQITTNKENLTALSDRVTTNEANISRTYTQEEVDTLLSNKVNQDAFDLIKENILTGSQTIYVAKSGNNSTGDGTLSKPFLTIQKALEKARKASGHYNQTISVGDGIYEEGRIEIGAFPIISLASTSGDKTRVIIKVNSDIDTGFYVTGCCRFVMQNLTLEGTVGSNSGVFQAFLSNVSILNCTITDKGASGSKGRAIVNQLV